MGTSGHKHTHTHTPTENNTPDTHARQEYVLHIYLTRRILTHRAEAAEEAAAADAGVGGSGAGAGGDAEGGDTGGGDDADGELLEEEEEGVAPSLPTAGITPPSVGGADGVKSGVKSGVNAGALVPAGVNVNASSGANTAGGAALVVSNTSLLAPASGSVVVGSGVSLSLAPAQRGAGMLPYRCDFAQRSEWGELLSEDDWARIKRGGGIQTALDAEGARFGGGSGSGGGWEAQRGGGRGGGKGGRGGGGGGGGGGKDSDDEGEVEGRVVFGGGLSKSGAELAPAEEEDDTDGGEVRISA